ncbi:hypothetical protein F7018_04495 [Tenacibaculum aiptasiae]|uniref:Uncharacterized protein n=1 Tax=Tenacibaculum aiptasiae TaxID=426481 RepID=A0A7J5APP6_9FLAO|nr:hypothetical protein [Tenacibaculum aiptasiae]KAB1159575.1 hypothetical protein F7018_04495 [Tenacibaculum aiptasiae]
MKKTFFLSKGIEKFSNLEVNDLSSVKGGLAGESTQVIIYYPTSGGGKNCPPGLVWSNRLGKCVKVLEAEPAHDIIRN